MGPLAITLSSIAGVVFLVLIVMYNGFISRRNKMRNAFASIDVQLKKRWDLVPQLVETVRGYASHADSLHAELTANGAEIQSEPVSRPWGLREFEVLDPEGNRLTFGEPRE